MNYSIGILVPLHEEFQYLSEIAPTIRTVRREEDYYFEVQPEGHSRPVLVAVLEEMGPTRAAVAAERMFLNFNVDVVALIGIAGALSEDAMLGDVVVASDVDHYLYAAKTSETSEGFPFRAAGIVYRAPASLINLARAFPKMPETRAAFSGWQTLTEQRQPAVPGWDTLSRPKPHMWAAPLASGDIVGSTEWFRDELLQRNRKLFAVEMEAAGVTASATTGSDKRRFIIVRGISDFADERKAKLDAQKDANKNAGAWRRYAMLSATEFLLQIIPYIDDNPIAETEGASHEPSDTHVSLGAPKRTSDEAVNLHALETQLSARYGTAGALRRLLKFAGVDPGFVQLSGSARVMCFNALEAAMTQGKLEAVREVVRKDYPDLDGTL